MPGARGSGIARRVATPPARAGRASLLPLPGEPGRRIRGPDGGRDPGPAGRQGEGNARLDARRRRDLSRALLEPGGTAVRYGTGMPAARRLARAPATLDYTSEAFRRDSVRLLAEAVAAGPFARVLPFDVP